MTRINRLWLLLALSFSTGTFAQGAPVSPYLTAKHIFVLGTYFQEADAKVRATVGSLPRQSIDLGDLGLDETDTSLNLEYRTRFNDKWGMVIAAHKFSSSGGIARSGEFNWDGKQIPTGAAIDTKFSVDTYFIDALYTVFQNERSDINVGMGIHAFDMETTITGRISVGERAGEVLTGKSDFLAPLPNLRVQGFYGFNNRWALHANIGWMSAKIDEYDGSFSYLHARTHYRIGDNFGLGIGYQYTDIDVTEEKRFSEREYKVRFTGPTVQVTYSF